MARDRVRLVGDERDEVVVRLLARAARILLAVRLVAGDLAVLEGEVAHYPGLAVLRVNYLQSGAVRLVITAAASLVLYPLGFHFHICQQLHGQPLHHGVGQGNGGERGLVGLSFLLGRR